MKVPMFGIERNYKNICKEVYKKLDRFKSHSDFILGRYVQEFEEKFAKFLGAKYAVGVASGTDALILSLKALGLKQDEEVATTPMTFFSTAESINKAGGKIVFSESSFNKIKFNILVHLYGIPHTFYFSKKIIIEDCCQAFGSKLNNKYLGTFGDVGCFSFFPTKTLGCWGDGGAIVTNNEQVYKTLISLRNYGQEKKYCHSTNGYNSRLDSLQAAVLLVKMKYINSYFSRRKQIVKKYAKYLTNNVVTNYNQCFGSVIDLVSNIVYNYYPYQTLQQEKLKQYLQSKGIQTGIYYPTPLHLQPCYKNLGYKEGDFPHSEYWAKNHLCLPIFPELTDKEVDYVIQQVLRFGFI